MFIVFIAIAVIALAGGIAVCNQMFKSDGVGRFLLLMLAYLVCIFITVVSVPLAYGSFTGQF